MKALKFRLLPRSKHQHCITRAIVAQIDDDTFLKLEYFKPRLNTYFITVSRPADTDIFDYDLSPFIATWPFKSTREEKRELIKFIYKSYQEYKSIKQKHSRQSCLL